MEGQLSAYAEARVPEHIVNMVVCCRNECGYRYASGLLTCNDSFPYVVA
jgi:hypothetical protein